MHTYHSLLFPKIKTVLIRVLPPYRGLYVQVTHRLLYFSLVWAQTFLAVFPPSIYNLLLSALLRLRFSSFLAHLPPRSSHGLYSSTSSLLVRVREFFDLSSSNSGWFFHFWRDFAPRGDFRRNSVPKTTDRDGLHRLRVFFAYGWVSNSQLTLFLTGSYAFQIVVGLGMSRGIIGRVAVSSTPPVL